LVAAVPALYNTASEFAGNRGGVDLCVFGTSRRGRVVQNSLHQTFDFRMA
jgi:hypothetical protein